MKIGVDMVDLNRLNLEHFHFIERVLTPNELVVYQKKKTDKQKREYLGGRFAAKEAVMKALGTGIGKTSFQEIEVLNKSNGCPYLNIENASISMSHENHYAIAFVVINEDQLLNIKDN